MLNKIKLLTLLITAVLVASISSSAMAQGAQGAQEAKMSTEDRAKVIRLLNESNKQTLASIEGLSNEQLHFKAAPEKWSVLEVAEHIMMAEGLLFSQVEAAIAAKPNPDWQEKTKGKTEFLEKVMVSRDRKASAPESIVPSGKLTRDEVISGIKAARAKTLKFAETTDLPLKAHTAEHPFPVFNTLNAYQWLIYVPLHNIRHNQQIEEVKANPNFPKK
ncbi:MAG: DinB family protein [Acidobacteria bacterium]|nr:DinB family protein [Acidobacteriota bacterium]